jgi:hypothetical protein
MLGKNRDAKKKEIYLQVGMFITALTSEVF